MICAAPGRRRRRIASGCWPRCAAATALDPQVAEQTARSIAEVRAGDEAREGIAAFFAKRKPSWIA